MIIVTRLNGQEIALNPDMIFSVEETPDTVIKLTNGDRFVLKDRMSEVVERFIAYKQQAHAGQTLHAGTLAPLLRG